MCFSPTPDLGDLEIQHYAPDSIDDSFDNLSWTVTALFGELEAIYTGAFTDRETDQIIDYTDYLFVGQYLPYYTCDTSVVYPGYTGDPAPTGNCYAPNMFVASNTQTEVQTHEFRFTTDQANRWRVTAGVFYSDLELKELNDFTYPGSQSVVGINGTVGFPDNYPLTNTSVTGEIGNAVPGYFSDPGPFPSGVVFRNDVLRTDEQLGVFGEFSYDFNDQWSMTLGARWYDIEVDFEGSANSSFCNIELFGTGFTDNQCAGTNISDKYSGNTPGVPTKAATDGTIFKATVDWRPVEGQMYYVTWSEGFRPGLLNRPGGAAGPNNFTVPYALDTDDVTNIELGLKADFFDSSFRLNAALFQVDIERLQTTIFDPSITNLFFSDNAADAEVTGFEGDFTWLPAFSERVTIGGAFSFLDTEITRVITPTNDVQSGDELAFAPDFQGNLRFRYEWDVSNSGWVAHVMPMVSWSSKSYSDVISINRDEIDSWTMWNLTAGVANETWAVELFGSNLTDERAELARNFVFDRQRVSYAAPRTYGVRATYHF